MPEFGEWERATDTQHKELEFDKWLAHIPTRFLECRVNRHRFPDWSDKKANWQKSRVTKTITVEVECGRHCGTTMTRFMDEDGYYTRSNVIRHFYNPEFGYLLPVGARGPGLTRERIAKMRRELMTRNEPRMEMIGQ